MKLICHAVHKINRFNFNDGKLLFGVDATKEINLIKFKQRKNGFKKPCENDRLGQILCIDQNVYWWTLFTWSLRVTSDKQTSVSIYEKKYKKKHAK